MKTCLSLLLLFSSLNAFAVSGSGSGVRGGGKGVVCRDAAQNVLSVELLDLWEARTLRNRTVQLSDAPVEEQVRAAIQRFAGAVSAGFDNEELAKLLRESTPQIYNRGADIFFGKGSASMLKRLRDVAFAPTDDAMEEAWPSKCALEQVAAYSNGAILLNQDLFEKMNPTNQAALIVHEAVYSLHLLEHMHAPNSVRARRAVGYVFSGGNFDAVPDSTVAHYNCTDLEDKAPSNYFTVYKDPDTGAPMGAIFDGFDETPMGYFPGKVRDFNDLARSFDTVLSDAQCSLFKDSETFWIAQLPNKGPVDFDRRPSLVGRCDHGKLAVFFARDGSIGLEDTDKLVPMACTFHPGR